VYAIPYTPILLTTHHWEEELGKHLKSVAPAISHHRRVFSAAPLSALKASHHENQPPKPPTQIGGVHSTPTPSRYYIYQLTHTLRKSPRYTTTNPIPSSPHL
jgi:hypothetical protein